MGGAIGITWLRTGGVGDQPWYSELIYKTINLESGGRFI